MTRLTRRRLLPLTLVVLLAGCSREAPKREPPREVAPPEPARTAPVSPTEGEPASMEAAPTGIRLGASIPQADVKMTAAGGGLVAIADARGAKGTLVVFTCNTCPYAKAWEKRIVALGNEYLGHGVGVIAINANDPGPVPDEGIETMTRRHAERGMKYPYVVDETSQVARAFGATRTPEAYLFDAGGLLVYHGTVDDNAQDEAQVTERYLRDALAAVVSGQPVPVTETKAMGCTIKYRPSS